MSIFTDAQEMAGRHPDTFEAPSPYRLSKIAPGSFVKICADNRERFWVQVSTHIGKTITGEVNNWLVCTDDHGLDMGAQVEFEERHVYGIMDK